MVHGLAAVTSAELNLNYFETMKILMSSASIYLILIIINIFFPFSMYFSDKIGGTGSELFVFGDFRGIFYALRQAGPHPIPHGLLNISTYGTFPSRDFTD